jgi:tetratricopeptide (TPR) repeat protein
MDDRERDRLATLLEQVLGLPPEARAAFLDEVADENPALSDELRSLVAASESSSGYFEELAERVVPPVLAAAGGAPGGGVAIGQTVSHYEILERVADGGMGVVYRARDLRLGRAVALKFLPTALTADAAARARLLAEARAASALDHPNIGVVHEVGETEAGGLFIAMGWYGGETLKERLRRGPIPVAEVIDVAAQIANALAAAHRAGIIHRDVKPSNVLIAGDGLVKLVDFGIAKVVGTDLTREGATLGTVAYMSPEQTRGEAVDGRTDVWSLGVVLYEMLAGERPFRGETDHTVIFAIRHDEPAPIGGFRDDLPDALAGAVERCLAKEPAGRYERAKDLLADLEAIDATRGSARRGGGWKRRHGRPRNVTKRSPGWSSRRRLGALAAMGAAAVLAFSGYLALSLPRRAALEPGRVVVARFENHTGIPGLDPLGSIAADWVIQGLSQTGLVQVVPMTAALSASRFASDSLEGAGPSQRIRMLALETGAGIVVTGAYHQQADSLYLWATVNDAVRERVLHAIEPFSTPMDQPIGAIEQLRLRLMAGLAPHLDPRIPDFVARMGSPPSYQAYRAFAEGAELFIAREWRGAIARFANAVALDAGFTAPLMLSGMAYVNLGDLAAVDSILVLARPHAQLMAEGDRLAFDLLEALTRGDRAAAYRAQLRGPEVAPGGLAHWGLANAAMWVNRPRETVRVSRQLDPERGELRGWYFYWRDLARAHHRLGEHRRELRVARRARELFPGQLPAVWAEARALAALGRHRELRALLDAELPGHPAPAAFVRQIALELLAHAEAEAGGALLRESLDRHRARPTDNAGYRFFLAQAHTLVGEWEDAERLLVELANERPDLWEVEATLGALAAHRGDSAEAARISTWLASVERPYIHGRNTYWRARIASLLGERDEAVRLLHQAFDQGMEIWDVLHTEPDFVPLRDYRPFRELARPKDS